MQRSTQLNKVLNYEVQSTLCSPNLWNFEVQQRKQNKEESQN